MTKQNSRRVKIKYGTFAVCKENMMMEASSGRSRRRRERLSKKETGRCKVT